MASCLFDKLWNMQNTTFFQVKEAKLMIPSLLDFISDLKYINYRDDRKKKLYCGHKLRSHSDRLLICGYVVLILFSCFSEIVAKSQ